MPRDMSSRIYPQPVDHFDSLPDSVLLLVFNLIGDVKALGRCSVVSRRFHSLVSQVDNVIVRVDCVISDDDCSYNAPADKSRNFSSSSPFSSIVRLLFGGIVKPFQALGQFVSPKRSGSSSLALGNEEDGDIDQSGVSHHSPTQVLENFSEIRLLQVELPSGEIGVDDDVFLKWRADYGSTLDNCLILGASSVTNNGLTNINNSHNSVDNSSSTDDNGSIPQSFFTNGLLKLRVVWTISSLIAASARHYLLQPIISDHKTLDNVILTDSDGQGMLCMNRDQLEELRVKPLSASSAAKRTVVPALNMELWYASHLELPGGIVLEGATLVAIRPSEKSVVKKEFCDGSWLSTAFEEPYATAVQMLLKKRPYCMEMNSF